LKGSFLDSFELVGAWKRQMTERQTECRLWFGSRRVNDLPFSREDQRENPEKQTGKDERPTVLNVNGQGTMHLKAIRTNFAACFKVKRV
jgi:hypothetical protein